MNIVLFDEPDIRLALLPFTFTRPVAAIRVGIYTIFEKWQMLAGQSVCFMTEEYLSIKFALETGQDNLFVNGAVCPTPALFNALKGLKPGKVLFKNGVIIGYRKKPEGERIEFDGNLDVLQRPWDIFGLNGSQIRCDFELLKRKHRSKPLTDKNSIVYNPENIFIEEGVKIRAAILNAEEGPIFIGKNSEIQEGAIIKGPFAMGERSQISMGAKIKGDTTLGPCCKVGGEVVNSVIFGYSNKAHDGFLGNSVLGEWCNLGADTNTSNLKNNYSEVLVYSYKEKRLVKTGKQFVGLMMGDHSKSGINTMFNTGTIVGVSANIFGGGYQPKFIPSFSWGGTDNFVRFQFNKAIDVAEKVMQRRNVILTVTDISILKNIYSLDDQPVLS
ncbi:MAG: GlmU family protein [Cytophagaceae bacterium]